ncbi:hypothetical protein CEXT_423081 [Caerostris extrusa]|uniref:Uncharacterized protein n=1 Tax=Caerostris extrusa TaxID=172846 RepID=A0AAV4XX09_CAEEX|nr:hypothetical protein CEXT_423081 [Caerostris extrusa]
MVSQQPLTFVIKVIRISIALCQNIGVTPRCITAREFDGAIDINQSEADLEKVKLIKDKADLQSKEDCSNKAVF